MVGGRGQVHHKINKCEIRENLKLLEISKEIISMIEIDISYRIKTVPHAVIINLVHMLLPCVDYSVCFVV